MPMLRGRAEDAHTSQFNDDMKDACEYSKLSEEQQVAMCLVAQGRNVFITGVSIDSLTVFFA